MLKNIRTLTLIIVVTSVFTGCRTTKPSGRLPPLSDGFHWEVFEEVGVAISSPVGWHRATSVGNGAYTGSVSLEDFGKAGFFKTGFTVQVLAEVKQRTGYPPSMMTIALGQQIVEAKENEVLAKDPLKENANSRSSFIRYRNSPALGDEITVHKFFVALDAADILYIFTFESPNGSWDEMFKKYGVPMMEQIVLL